MPKPSRDHLILNASDELKRRFVSRVKKGPDCWEWTGMKALGYGVQKIAYQMIGAHRCVAIWRLGKKSKLFACHRCNNRGCVRPDHIYLGTPKDNVGDMVAAKTHGGFLRFGSKSAVAVLTEAKARQIFKRYHQGGISMRTLGRHYGVSADVISHLVRRKTWTHVTSNLTASIVDRRLKGYQWGEGHVRAKVSAAQVRMIRSCWGKSATTKELATLCGISKTQVLDIKNGKSWRKLK